MQRRTTGYSRLPTEDPDGPDVASFTDEASNVEFTSKPKRSGAFLPEQFQLKAEKIPWKPIGLAFLLFLGGSLLLTAGCLIHTGHVDNETYGDRLWPLIVLGALMFIPGSYHVYIAVNVFLGSPGFSFDDIPQLEWANRCLYNAVISQIYI